jgi:gliding motility-associated-like protein
VQIGASTTAPGPTYSWTGPGGFTSTLQNPVVSTPGNYTVTVSTTSNGCTNSATVSVTGNSTVPTANATGGTLTCANPSIQITGTTNVPSAGFVWTGPNGYTATGATPTVTAIGTYDVTVTNLGNGCTATASTTVNINNTTPGATALSTGIISCPTPTVLLNSSTQTGTTFNWSGPGGFSSSNQNPTATTSGTYTVTVTGANGCTSTDSAVVTGDTNPPNAGANGGTISCGTPSITLNGLSTTSNVSYDWSGPGSFTSGQQNPIANTVGTYTVTVTATNGCTSTASTPVNGDFANPTASASGGIITCTVSSITITSSSTTPGVNYSWNGPGNFLSTQQNPSISSIGTYTVTVTGGNGCTNTAEAIVTPDAGIPIASATGGTLNCLSSSVTISGSTTTPGATTGWTGPGGFTSTQSTATVNTPGQYVLTVVAANGCKAFATANVNLDTITPGAGASADTISCTSPSTTLKGTTNGNVNNVTWTWAGPSSFSSNQQNPTATLPGNYSLIVTGLNGCTSQASVGVGIDIGIPVVSLTSDTLTCSAKIVQIQSNVSAQVTYSWDGPNGYTSLLATPAVMDQGNYTVTVTASNGCTATKVINVKQDITVPSVASVGNTISCNNPTVDISVTTTAPGATYLWNNSANTPQIPVASPGTYTVTITGANGCTSIGTAVALIDTVTAALQVTAPPKLTCATPSVTLQTTITPGTSPVKTIIWTAAGGYTSAVKDAVVTVSGLYTLEVTTANGCKSSLQTNVDQDITPPNAVAAGSTLSCTITSNTIKGTSTTAGATFTWTGPPPFTSNQATATITNPGSYILTVTGPNGCTSVDTAVVLLDAILPDAAATSSNNLDCTNTSTTLTGTSVTSGVTYGWTGPNGFTSPLPEVNVSTPGVYNLVVTASNGCTKPASLTVSQDLAQPNVTATGGTISCASGTAQITATSTTPGVTFQWSPDILTSGPTQTVSKDTTYTVLVTAPNGCTNTATAVVAKNVLAPDADVSGGGVLNCLVDSLKLVGTIHSAGAVGVWSGPGIINTKLDTAVVNLPGTYTFTVTATANGCKTAPTLTVTIDTLKPKNVTAFGGLITCIVTSVTIKGNSTSPNVAYKWSGPNGFASNLKSPTGITVPGDYVLTVTSTVNGCTKTATAKVTNTPDVPVVTLSADTISCTKPTSNIHTTCNITGVSYAWTGPNGYTSTAKEPAGLTDAGQYQVVVTAGTSGCRDTSFIKVATDTVKPDIKTIGDTLSCTTQSAAITASSSVTNAIYAWSGPAGFTSALAKPIVSTAGQYIVTVTNPSNGCSSTATAVATPDFSAPTLEATGGVITCLTKSIVLTSKASVPITVKWQGPAGFTSTLASPTATQTGTYIVVGTAANGCSDTKTVEITADTLGPVTTIANPKELNCTTTQVALNASVPPSGNFTFSWTTSNGTILPTPGTAVPNPQVTAAGNYVLVVTDTHNGCTTQKSVNVILNAAKPNAIAYKAKDVNCFGDTNGAVIVSGATGGTPPYLYSLDNSPFSPTLVFPSLAPKSYKLAVQDANGCEFEENVQIGSPDLLTVQLGLDTTIQLGDSIDLSLAGITNHPERIETINIDPGGLFPITNPDAIIRLGPQYSFQYTVTVSDSSGCKASDQRLIIVDKTRHVYIPNIFNPNSRGVNNLFYIFGGNDVEKIKSFQVFDRWGDMVHEYYNFAPNNPDSGWDGKVKGQKAVPAVFVYYAEILFKDGEVVLYKGDVTLEY